MVSGGGSDGDRGPRGRRGGRGARGAKGRGRGARGSPGADSRHRLASGDSGLGGGTPPDRKIVVMKDRERDSFTGFTGHSTLPSSNGLGSASSLERLLGSEGEGDFAEDHQDNINVVVRVRPLSMKEDREGDVASVRFPGEGQVWVDMGPTQKAKAFTYNVVFEPESTQEDVLEHSGVKRLVDMALDGFSCTIFCYGQTGSGKTHTLTGPPNLFKTNPNPFADGHGLVFRSFVHLFQQVSSKQECQFVLRASFLEIYNEKVIDLLNPGTARKPLAVRWSKKSRGFFVENLFTVECQELDDLLAVLEEGLRNRAVGSHNMNEYSSRSHTMLTVYITSEQQASEEGVFISRHGKLNFVDLAGSEMTKKTQSEGKTLEEANNINKSLMVLGYCIASLSDPKKRTGHIPYRDSKLTKLLADSLAGNGVTLMIACISPARSNLSETLNTLRYAARAKRIRTKPVVVMDPREALILQLKREVTTLRNENTHLRTLLDMKPLPGDVAAGVAGGAPALLSLASSRTPPPSLDLEKLRQLDSDKLADMVHEYLVENEALRKEASELSSVRDVLLRDQELVCRENERLLKKLEDVNSVCLRSPIAPVRPTYSAEMLNLALGTPPERPGAVPERPSSVSSPMTDVWTNSEAPATTKLQDLLGGPRSPSRLGRSPQHSPGPWSGPGHSPGQSPAATPEGESRPPHRLPDSIRKEMDKRRIGRSMNNIADSYREKAHRRQNSWEGGSRDNGEATPPLPPVRGKRVPRTPEEASVHG